MPRRRHRLVFWLVGFPLLLVVAVVALLSTPPATRFIVQRAIPMINRQLNGSITVSRAKGSLFGRLDLRGVTVRDPAGTPLATAERVIIGYRLLDFLRGRIQVDPVIVESPSITMVQNRPGEPYPLLRVFQRNAGPSATRSSFTVNGLLIRQGAVVATVPAGTRAAREERRGNEALLRTVRVRSLNLDLPSLAVETGAGRAPDVEVRVDRASADVIEPRLSLRALEGTAEMRGDSLSVDLARAEFPETRLSLKGWMIRDTIQRPAFEGELHLRQLSANDFTSLSPQIPADWKMQGDITAAGDSAGNLHADLRTFEIVAGREAGSIRGHLGMNVAPDGRWRQRDTELEIQNLDLGPLVRRMKRPPPVPITGRLRGRLLADGPQDSLTVRVDLALRQPVRDTMLESRLRGEGEVSLPLGGQLFVRHFTVDTALVEMRALRAANPRIKLTGRLDLDGSLRGSASDMAFRGGARYREGSLPPSELRATVRLARHSPLHIDAELQLDSLRLSGFRQSFPELERAEAVGGTVRLSGPLDTLAVEGSIGGVPGRLRLSGVVAIADGSIAVSSARAEVDSLNLAAVSSAMPPSILFASLAGDASMRGDTLERASVRVSVDTSRVGGMAIETASAAARSESGMLYLDSLRVRATGLELNGDGTLGLDTTQHGSMTLTLTADSLGQMEPLFDMLPDSAAALVPRSGAVHADATVTGSLREYSLAVNARVQRLVTAMGGVKNGNIIASWRGGDRHFAIRAGVDSLATSALTAERLDARAQGTLSAFRWDAAASFAHNGKASAAGTISGDAATGRIFDVDSLILTRDSATWKLDQPARIELRNERWEFSNTVLTRKGPGDPARIAVTGALAARDSSGRISAVVENFPLADLAVYNAAGEGKPLSGTVDGRFDLAGSVRNPTGRGQLTLLNAAYDTLPLPELRARASYLDGVLDANMAILFGARPSVLEARIPLRREAGAAAARMTFTADSLSIAWLDPLLPAVQDLAGRLDGTVSMTGSFDSPDFTGGLAFTGGEMTVLSLGLHYGQMTGRLGFSGETIRLEHFAMSSRDHPGEDSLVATGTIRLATLRNPILNLDLEAVNFRLMNNRTLFTGSGTGRVNLSGPFFSTTLTGAATVNTGNAYVDKFIQKQVVDLTDSLYAQFVDTTVLVQQDLGADPVTLFIAGLYVDGLDVDLGNDFWMRSADADIQLGGRLTVGKVGKQYTVDGTVNTLRGTYTLRLAPGTSREFQVRDGTIRYFGTSDLNAQLDVNATHELQTSGGDQMTVQIHIGGTIEEPRIDFSTNTQPPLAESEVISYLIFGAPSFQAFVSDRSGERRSVFEQSVEGFTGVLSGQLESSLASFLPLDYFKIKPGEIQSGLSGTELILGKQINLFGYPSWLRASPRICPRQALLSLDQIGLSIETRLGSQWGIAASLDPLRGCETTLPPASNHYGLGLDVFWQRRGISFGGGKKPD